MQLKISQSVILDRFSQQLMRFFPLLSHFFLMSLSISVSKLRISFVYVRLETIFGKISRTFPFFRVYFAYKQTRLIVKPDFEVRLLSRIYIVMRKLGKNLYSGRLNPHMHKGYIFLMTTEKFYRGK